MSTSVDKPTIFISHITDESELARTFQAHLKRDFLGLIEVFVSSDGESIEAGENWLATIEAALIRARVEIVLCSRASVNRPWINFEAGAGWIRQVRIIPLCHSGLKPADLPMPLRVLQGIEASQSDGLLSLYRSIAKVLGSEVPRHDFSQILADATAFEAKYSPHLRRFSGAQQQRDVDAMARMMEALLDENYVARSVRKLAVLGGISESEALDLLRADPDVKFDSSKSLGRLAKLKSRERTA